MTDTSAFFRLVKSDKQADGTLIVSGIATDSSLDSDEQICDPVWLKSAMPNWFRWGNIREQHSSIAAGVATEYQEKDGVHYITARVVDPASVMKVETGVLKGFSVGIRGPRVIKDDKAAGGRIVDGEIVEVSLVDRPANPVCTLSLAKSVDGTMTAVEELTVKAVEESTEESTEGSTADGEVTIPPKEEESSVAPVKAVAPVEESSQAVGEESSQAVGEESSQAVGEESSREGGVAGVAGKGDMADLHGKFDALQAMVAKMCDKMFGAPDDTEKSLSEDMTKALNERLSVLEKSATESKAPVRMVVAPKVAPTNEIATKAQAYRLKAMEASDPRLAQGYLGLALDLEKSL